MLDDSSNPADRAAARNSGSDASDSPQGAPSSIQRQIKPAFGRERCPYCSSTRYEPFATATGRAERRCLDCGTIYDVG